MRRKCIILLSTKSAGSSACQRFFVDATGARHVTKTRHFENETLYWTKAASILGLPQVKLLDSEVPIETQKAKRDLLQLLNDNLDSYIPPTTDRELIFDGWRQLCRKFGPVFFEKSPHHLYQWSNIELIIECVQELHEIDFHILGLIRNPMDTLYSAWKRFGTRPEENQYQWSTAYSNLLKLQSHLGDHLSIFRYKDMVSDSGSLQKVLNLVGRSSKINSAQYFHQNSMARWRADRLYGFRLAEPVIDLAMQYGYKPSELINDRYPLLWRPYSKLVQRRIAKRQKPKRAAQLKST